ncbi:MAG TPA: asparagine synthase (glutamine-hydrolyzing) [Longimicrobium sp.]|nr:asparagine synthase (glutamine-hydrolyzing) [Longimicrobium sp.]
MCGIVGIAAREGVRDRGVLAAMRDTLRHRGPDDAGEWWDPGGRVGLGHRRLSILDPTPAGHQPMEDSAGRAVVTFNGEIYNFQELRDQLAAGYGGFHTRTDTEVLLAAYRRWGDDCVRRLRGMFAFAIHDLDRGTVLLARDRAGEKPLFYRHAGGRLSFASELKGLMADPELPRVADAGALDFYLAYGYVPGEHCILKGVRKLAPGTLAVYDVAADRLEVRRYWTIPNPPSEAPPHPGGLVDELEGLLLKAVGEQLVADVPVGILLSGGIDSSLVTAFAAQASSGPIDTFTVSFPGHRKFDEDPHARIVAEHFGTRHHVLPMEQPGGDLLLHLARQFDEPLADSSLIPTYLLSRLVRRHATVALGGDGGDELFAGYPHHRWLVQGEALRGVVPPPLRRLASAAGRRLPVGTRGRNHLIAFEQDVRTRVAHVNLYFDHPTRRRLLAPLGAASLNGAGPEAYKGGLCDYGTTALQKATAADFRAYLPDDVLVKVDRASMLASLETRAPFLDHRVIEFAFGRVPDEERAGPGGLKILLRRLAYRVLPPALKLERKRGFSIPLASWLRGPWGDTIRDALAGADPGVFDRVVIDDLLHRQEQGFSNAHRIFALAMFELWRREYGVSVEG